MSEDRLDQALEGMKGETVNPEQLAAARARVWERLGTPGAAACTEFQAGLRDYLEERLDGSRRMLMEDHLSRCPRCRTELAGLKGTRKTIAMPQRRVSWWPRWGAWAAAAALVLAALYLGRDRIDTMLAPGGPRATVASLNGGLYRVPEGALQAGASFGEGEVVRTGPDARAVLRLADGSLVEVNERSELFVNAAWSGQTIHLQRGDIIVKAAKQRRGHLRVQTRDSVASVKGTVFAVSSGLRGTVVSVVEGSVAVTRPGGEVVLRPGQQAASYPGLEASVQEAVAWSLDAETYQALLASFAQVEKQLAQLPPPVLRTQSSIVQYLPANVVVYGAIPNLSGTISQAMMLFDQQAAENPTFRDWWNFGAGQELKALVERIQSVTPLLGDEIVFTISATSLEGGGQVPMVVAEVQPGKRAELVSALEALRSQAGGAPLPYSVTDTLVVVSDTQTNLQWLFDHLGQGAATPFAAAIASRYQRGAGWLLGVDADSAFSSVSGSVEAAVTGIQQVKYLFIEQRTLQGAEHNEVTVTFKGPRMGLVSWLADSGSGGAAEYISGDAVFAVYASTREPRQLFDELMAQLAKTNPSAGSDLAAAESRLGVGFAGNLASAFGTESAFAVEGISVTGPVWVMAALVNNPSVVDDSLRKLVDAFNSALPASEEGRRITLEQENIDGRAWTTLKTAGFPLTITWTYDRGYLVAASDRGAAVRAIATRNGGSPLVWSAAFQQQLPANTMHPSGFAWLNTKGAFQGFASLMPGALQTLAAERDPILVVFDGSTEQIHAASRIRLSGLIMDIMMLERLSRAGAGPQPALLQNSGRKPSIR